ncbi:AsmA family protein [Methylorubrum populi]|uniref:AsmA family protein n=1 Tax=Methylobacterium radiotolerans TaxID=31998 RepID=A0ABU7TEL6_9HYPH
MSLRRTLPALGFGLVAAGLVAACLPWSVEAPGVSRFVSRGLQQGWGVALTARGRTGIVLLPVPRVVFEDIRLNEGDEAGPILAAGGSLSLQLDLPALITGRVEVDSLSLHGAEVHLPQQAGDTRWAGATERLMHSIADESNEHPRRIILARATVTGRDPRDGALRSARDVNLTLSWPAWSESLALAGSLRWNDQTVQLTLTDLRPHALLSGETSPFVASLAWPSGSLSAEGGGSLREGFKASGSGILQTRSLPGTLALTGSDLALSPFVQDLSVEGSFEAAAGQIQFPNVTVRTGGNILEGAGSASFGPRRNAVQATLAADNLNLSPLLADLLSLTGLDEAPDAAWRRRPLDLRPLTGGDLDLRISAGSARIGPVQMSDLASSVLVREDGIEASLGRATVQGGVIKGRAIFSSAEGDPTLTRVKAQGSFDRLDLGALLTDLGQDRWMLGASQGSLAVEGAGRDTEGMIRALTGRLALASADGALSGLDLADVVQRRSAPAPGSLARRNGRTSFEKAAISVLFADGVGEIVEGALTARGVRASLSGRIGLMDRRLQARAELRPPTPASGDGTAHPATLFEITGPWTSLSVRGGADEAAPTNAGDAFQRPGADLPLGIRAYVPANTSETP